MLTRNSNSSVYISDPETAGIIVTPRYVFRRYEGNGTITRSLKDDDFFNDRCKLIQELTLTKIYWNVLDRRFIHLLRAQFLIF